MHVECQICKEDLKKRGQKLSAFIKESAKKSHKLIEEIFN